MFCILCLPSCLLLCPISQWAFFGECDKNPGYMLVGCKKSCKVCDPAKINTGRVIDVPIKTA